MIYIKYGIFFLCFILCVLWFIGIIKNSKKKKRLTKEILIENDERIKEKLLNAEDSYRQKFQECELLYTDKINKCKEEFYQKKNGLDSQIESYNKLIKQQREQQDYLVNKEQEIIAERVKTFEAAQIKQVEEKVERHKKELWDNMNEQAEELLENITALQETKETEIKAIEEFRKERAAINEAIRREEEAQNEIDFHRIILTENDKEDIMYILSIEEKIHNRALLRKLIWSEYIQKPFNKMIHNLFGSSVPKNVIYCIENIETKKKYIGKTSAEASKRWTEHIKTSLGIGSVAKSGIHDALYKHWDEFTFSVVEVTEKSKLSEKEKFYIKMFETDKFGYNRNSGG